MWQQQNSTNWWDIIISVCFSFRWFYGCQTRATWFISFETEAMRSFTCKGQQPTTGCSSNLTSRWHQFLSRTLHRYSGFCACFCRVWANNNPMLKVLSLNRTRGIGRSICFRCDEPVSVDYSTLEYGTLGLCNVRLVIRSAVGWEGKRKLLEMTSLKVWVNHVFRVQLIYQIFAWMWLLGTHLSLPAALGLFRYRIIKWDQHCSWNCMIKIQFNFTLVCWAKTSTRLIPFCYVCRLRKSWQFCFVLKRAATALLILFLHCAVYWDCCLA